MPASNPQCFFCWHYRRTSDRTTTCAAFPTGIPDLILENAIPHDRAMLGQEGDAVYKPLPEHAMNYPFAMDHFTPLAEADPEEAESGEAGPDSPESGKEENA